MKQKIALFPGSFDPFTIGHESLVRRSLPIFDKLIIGVGYNDKKKGFISLEKRLEIIKKIFDNESKVEVVKYSGLTVDFCKEINAKYILRGLRTAADFEFERAIGQTNKLLDNNIETVFLLTLPEHSFISSSVVRDVIKNGGNLKGLLPDKISIEDFK